MDSSKKTNKKQRSSDKQLDHMIDFMVKHNKFASGKFQGIQGKKVNNDLWERLKMELNEIGPIKSTEQWKKVSISIFLLGIHMFYKF